MTFVTFLEVNRHGLKSDIVQTLMPDTSWQTTGSIFWDKNKLMCNFGWHSPVSMAERASY